MPRPERTVGETGAPARLKYRAGLDGVRAIAVTIVVLYHAKFSVASGGFVGVDVFFVLSGFLITSLLLSEYAFTGTIDLVRFWLARMRRLLPAALLVIVASLLVVAIFSPNDLASLRGDALASVLYVNNWHQILAHRSYFAAFGRPSLLQHFWSLAVEEQFYLIWPPLLLVGLRFLRRRQLVAGAALGAVASGTLMVVLYDPAHDPSRVYYATDTRAMPLLVGVVLAFVWPAMRDAKPIRGSAAAVLDGVGLLGLALVLYAVVQWVDYQSFVYRGGLEVLAIGAALLIASASHPSTRVGKALGCAPMRWIGRRSYGIYLWHWPVMVMSRPGLDFNTGKAVLVPIQIGVTVTLAAASYKYVELPIRQGRLQARTRSWLNRVSTARGWTAIAAAPALVAIFVIGIASWPASATGIPHEPTASAIARVVLKPHHVVRDTASRSTTSTSTTPTRASTPLATPKTRPYPSQADGIPRGPILMVGASVMLAAIQPLEHKLHAHVDAVVSRPPETILDRLKEYRAAGRLPPIVVVQTGENAPLSSGYLTALRHVLQGVKRVVLMTLRAPNQSWIPALNAEFVRFARTWPQARIGDWAAVSGNPSLTWDGTHPDPAGAIVYERVVAKAIYGSASGPG